MGRSRRIARRLIALFFTLIVIAFSPRNVLAQAPAGAMAELEEAKRKGDEAMVALRYEEALAHYRKAFEGNKNPALLYNMGRAYEGLAEFPMALDALEEFADKATPDLRARVPKLEELLRDVRNRVATLVVSSSVDGAEIRLGAKVIGKTKPGQVVLRVNAGKQKLVVTREGYFPFEKELPLTGAKVETVEAVMASRTVSAVLRVTSPVAGAAVSLDGKGIGIVPAESFVAPGAHKLELQRDGYTDAQTSVVLAAGEKKAVEVPMTKHASVFTRWWFWTAVGAVLTAGGVTLFALTSERSADTGTIPPGQVKAELRLGSF